MWSVVPWIDAVMKAALVTDDFRSSGLVIVDPDQAMGITAIWHMDNIFPLPAACVEDINGALNVACEPKLVAVW